MIQGGSERSVGQIPDSTPEEALAFYVRRFENLAAEVTLLESRVAAQAMSPEEAKAAMYTMPDYQQFDYPTFGPGSGEAVRLDDATLGLDS